MFKRLAILFAIVMLGLISLRITHRPSPGPPTYQGKTMEYWFTQLPVTPVPPPGVNLGNARGVVIANGQQYGGTNLSDNASFDAFTAFGTNAMPLLLERLRGVDSPAEKKITQVATQSGVKHLPFRQAELERLQAVTGLIHAKTLTPETRQAIVALGSDSHPDIAAAAAYILKRRAALGELVPSGLPGNSAPAR